MLKFFCLFFLLSSLCLRALFGELEESAPLLTIEESVRLAQERNKTIEIAGFRIEQAIASKNEMRSALLPFLQKEYGTIAMILFLEILPSFKISKRQKLLAFP